MLRHLDVDTRCGFGVGMALSRGREWDGLEWARPD